MRTKIGKREFHSSLWHITEFDS